MTTDGNPDLRGIRSLGLDDENQPFLEPSDDVGVRLTPAWESRNLPPEQLNFQDVAADESGEYGKEPPDRLNAIMLVMTLLGIGTLMPWNMFITAIGYFNDYKFNPGNIGGETWYRANFMPIMTFAAQCPTFLFSWLNVFVQLGGNFTTRVVVSLSIMILVFVLTVALAMIDTFSWTGVFFYITIGTVVVMNAANAVYQNTVFGTAAKLPPKYIGTVVLGTNISGTFTATVSIISIALSPNPRASAVYYFIAALFILLACFDAYFALPLSRFFRYHSRLADAPRPTVLDKSDFPPDDPDIEVVPRKPPMTKMQRYLYTIKKCWLQGFNAFYTLFITLVVFPGAMSMTQMSDPNFIIPPKFYHGVVVFFTFNFMAMIGNILPNFFIWPGPKFLVIPVILRTALVPLILLCNYQPFGYERIMPVILNNDWAFWGVSLALGITSGYYSSLAMMYGPSTVEPEFASTAGMLCGACLVSGIFAGICCSNLLPIVVANITW